MPSWCNGKWCYVDPANCKRSLVKSDLAPSMSYSYETCGDLGSHYMDWRSVPINKRLGRPLYVWAAGYKVGDYRLHREGMNLNLRATLTFANQMLARLGVDPENPSHLQYRELSGFSKAHYPSSRYTACVYEIALGNLDLCIGPVWDTDERRAMNVSFTGTIFVEEMALLMPVSERMPPDLNTIFFKTFEPFSCGLWMLILCTLGLSCLAMVVFEHWLTPTAAVSSHSHGRTIGSTVTSWFLSFLAGEVTLMPVTSGGKVFSLGYGFFILVCISCYTANMATILIGEDQNPSRIDSISDALKMGRQVCYHAALPMATVRLLYPGLNTAGTPIDGAGEGLKVWKDSGCEVCILSENMMADDWASRNDCDWFLKGRPVLSVPNGFYSSNALSHEVSWMASKLRLDGTWDRILREVKHPSLCDTSAHGSGSQLNATHMLGAIVILVLCFIAGLLVHSYELSSEVDCCDIRGVVSGSEDDDGDEFGVVCREDSEAKCEQLSPKAALTAEAMPALARLQAQLQEALREVEELRGGSANAVSPLRPLLRYFALPARGRSSRE